MTTLNTIIEEEKVVARGKWIYKPENQTSSEVLDEIVTTAMQRVAKEVREERDTYWKERVRSKREALAELEHIQWIAWSKNIAETEQITPARLERWKKLWRPYSELTEAEKDQDREWADQALNTLLDNLK